MKLINSILSTVRNLYLIALISIGLCIGTNVLWAGYCVSVAATQQAKVYVPTPSGTLIATAQDPDHRTMFEARYHAQLFVTKLLAWDAHTYTANMDAALPLIDKDEGMRIFADIEKQKIYEKTQRLNARSYVDIENVAVDMSEEPYQVSLIGIMSTHHADVIDYLKFEARFTLTKVRRSDDNPCGLLIRNWSYQRLGGGTEKVDKR